MTVTYDNELSSDKDVVRLMIGDNTLSTAVFQDEEIVAILNLQTATGAAKPYFAAAELLETMYRIFKSERKGAVERQISKLRLRFSEDVSAGEAIRKEAQRLRTRGGFLLSRSAGIPYHFRIAKDDD